MTTIKKKIISVVALLCAVMLLIGILPTSVFRNNNASAAGSGDYKLRIVYPVVVNGSNPYYSNMYIHAWDGSGSTTGFEVPQQMDRTDHVYEINLLRQATTYKTTPAGNWDSGASDECYLDWSKADGNVLTLFANSISGYTLSTTYIEPSTQFYRINFDLSDVYSTLSTLDGISTFGVENSTNYGPYYVDQQQDSYIYHFDYFDKQYSTVALTIHKFSTWNITFNDLDWSQAKDNTLNIKVKNLTASGTGGNSEQLYTPTFEYGSSSVAGETLYIIGNNITKPTVTFYNENGDEITEGLFNVETVISGNLTNYNDSGNNSYSVVIPEGATQVSFDGGTTKLDLSNYNTSTSNAYDITNNSWVSYTEPDIRNSTLYIDTADSSYTAPIKITYGGTTATMTNVSGTIYKYKLLGSGLLPTKDTPITISDNNGKNVTLYYNPNVTNNLFNLKNSTWSHYTATYNGKVYFDATLSKLSYQGTISPYDYGIPESSGTVYCWASDSNTSGGQQYTMTKMSDSDIYYVELPQNYKYITFAGFSLSSITNYGGHGESTSVLEIPTDLENPCFYADTSDSVIYDGGTRSGYWDEVNSIRDAETGKTGKDVVKIDNTTSFTKENNKFYVNSTFYDYYTDYELNGNNRSEYGGTNGASHRNYVNFRQFDQALSQYYRDNGVSYTNAIYTGHFQPSIDDWGNPFSEIYQTLDLLGADKDKGVASDEYKVFISNNNSVLNSNGVKLNRTDGNNGGYYDYATQNLVSWQLKDGLPTSYVAQPDGSGDDEVVLPYFNEDFLSGTNSKNTKIGDVYHNVAFPFTQKDVNNDGVNYWVFDSAETTLAMKEDKDTGKYFLQDVGNQRWSKNVNAAGTAPDEVSGDSVSNTYGFFPFNEYTTAASGKNYNYGFGTKLEFKFRLTNDGTVTNTAGTKVPITFEFSGDDDVWVFIDGKLALDVGGDHGQVTGTINFKELTSTVSKVKTSANNDNEGTDVKTLIGKTGSSESAQDPAIYILNNTMSGDSPTADNNMSQEHTLTMFYMERGMWESNMKVQFNFPDENQLEVEKVVDKTDVNPLFTDLFDNQSIFGFSIQNLATHYGTKAVESSGTSGSGVKNEIFNTNFESATLTPAGSNTFEHIDSWASRTNVVKWYAKLEDKTNDGVYGTFRSKRWGTFPSDSNNVVDITNYQYLSFMYYYDGDDTPSLSHMYIQLVDKAGNTLGSLDNGGDYLYGRTYGSTTMVNKSWQTITVDLSKLTDNSGSFDKTQVEYIRFGYDYPVYIYLDEFTFKPSASSGSKLTGFVTKQYEIPDYGSAQSGTLKPAAGATYTSSKDEGTTQAGQAYAVDTNGGFFLENNETILFRDQFRRGSYISLTEDLTEKQQKLFKTSYTVYENDQAVTSFGTSTTTITNKDDSITTLKGVTGYAVNDGRTEYKAGSTDMSDGHYINNDTDTTSDDYNKYDGTKPSGNTFVFRSYSDPDGTATATKLKVVYTNTIKTGSLTITKSQATGSQALSGTYTFVVEFSNVGGIGLETSSTETFTLGVGESKTITGIPVGTNFKIHELTTNSDGAFLESVTSGSTSVTINKNDTVNNQSSSSVSGTIPETENATTSYTFSNMKKEVVSFEVTKQWQKSDGTTITDNLPTSIYVQLQRKLSSDTDWTVVTGYEKVEISLGYDDSWSTFKYTFKDLDKYQNNDTSKPYSYQVVEVNSDGTALTDNKITLNGTEYTVSYGEVTISGSVYSQIITNKAQPTHSLTVYKVDGADTSHSLSGAEFTLKQGDNFVPITRVSDGNYRYDTSSTTVYNLVTDIYGSFTVEGLPNGEYALTETQAPGGYLMNSDNVYTITFGISGSGDGTGTCTIGENPAPDYVFSYTASTNTATLTVSNLKITLPETGGTGSGINIVFIGIVFVLIAGAGFVLVNRKAFYRKKN